MNNISDNELIIMALEENEDAKNKLFEKYRYIINILVKKYQNVSYYLDIDQKDLYSEGLYGFSDALANYDQDKEASLATFITICVERRIRSQLIKAGRLKNKINTEAYSLDMIYDAELGYSLKDIIRDDKNLEPLESIASEESYQELITILKKDLSDFEYQVFSFLAKGFNYNEIALFLNKKPKQIDNTIQRIKVKLKKVLESRKNT